MARTIFVPRITGRICMRGMLGVFALTGCLSIASSTVLAQRAVPRESSGGGARSGGGESSGPAPQGARPNPGGEGQSSGPGPGAPPAGARPRGNGDRTVGTAVARAPVPPNGGGGPIFVSPYYYPYYPYYGYGYGYPYYGYYPWGYGAYGYGYGGFGFGLSFGYGYGGPWYGYPAYAYAPSPATVDGAVRLKVSPTDATVYVDGYYAGRVEDFDGTFQRLHVEPGAHRIEVRATGYDTLTFDVRILPDRTVTYSGELKKL